MILLCFIVFDFFQNYPPCMPNTRRGREPLFPYDHELECTLRNMNRNLGINDDDPNQNIPALVDVHGQLLPDAAGEHKRGDKIPLHSPKHTTEAMIT